ncbi:MAG TPA: hypothetical protein VLJ80_14435 [Solirubrobacteraceae bacterium]|nr:hypothetical protein [Solirubrobacteraceae bacterium]
MTSGTTVNLEQGAFGVPDGSRAEIEVPTFVELDPAIAQTGLISDPADRAVRVFVGKKGSGKTVYLRRFQAAANDEDSVYATGVDQNSPATDNVTKFSRWYRGGDITERWSMAWRIAVLRSLCSHLLFARALSSYGSIPDRKTLRRLAEEAMPDVGTPRSVYDQLGSMISTNRTRQAFDAEVHSGIWADLEYWLRQIIQDAPPIFFYLDAVDEEYATAPSDWLRCQKGLFHQVMRFLRDPDFGGRLHIVIAIRDNVFASILRSEHATRYRTDPHVRVLAWDRPAVRFFFARKLERLSHEQVMYPHSRRTVAAWLGHTQITNAIRDQDEDLEDYIVRHTRMLPRDIVLMGNELAEEVRKAKGEGRASVPQARIRDTVSKVAAWCGNEQLFVCGNQILGDSPYQPAMDQADGEEHIYERIAEIVRSVGTDQFGPTALAQLAEQGRMTMGDAVDLTAVLWQNGLLGFGDASLNGGEWVFHGVEDVDRLFIPLDRERYALHPCLLDALGFRGAGAGTKPVRPWRRGAA